MYVCTCTLICLPTILYYLNGCFSTGCYEMAISVIHQAFVIASLFMADILYKQNAMPRIVVGGDVPVTTFINFGAVKPPVYGWHLVETFLIYIERYDIGVAGQGESLSHSKHL